MSDDGLRDIKAAAAWLDVKFTWLRDQVTARKVPHTRVGRHVRFTQHHLDAIVAAGEQPVATAPSWAQVRSIRSVTAASPPVTQPPKTPPPPAAPRTPPPPAGPKKAQDAA